MQYSRYRRAVRPAGRQGFTLVELLVVVGIIALLISILMPVLNTARERAQRIVCANQLKQLGAAVHMYANENKGRLPFGGRDGNPDEHCIWIAHETYNAFVRVTGPPDLYDAPVGSLGSKRLVCPNLLESGVVEMPFRPDYGGGSAIGWVIGYNYLGDKPKIMKQHGWRSPRRVNETGTLPIFADLNDWSPPDRWTIIPHRRQAGGGFFYGAMGGNKPTHRFFQATGGNVGFLDGSVHWRDITEMKEYPTYNFAGGAYMGMW
jgi:prepilin-type N-terminal cleavage/methylation domain-containing protein/prepilin-type processing-associated H-X9-DG protein